MNSFPFFRMASPIPLWGKAALFFVVYFFLLITGAWWTFGPNHLAVLCPSCGFFLGVLLRSPRIHWPLWFLLSLLAMEISMGAQQRDNLSPGQSLLLGPLFWLANSVSLFLGASLLRRIIAEPFKIIRLADLLAFVCMGGIMTPLVGATIGTVLVAPFQQGSSWTQIWTMWLGADLVGCLLLGPLVAQILAPEMGQKIRQLKLRELTEALLMMAVIMTVVTIVFGLPNSVPVSFLVFPLVIWPALRFGFEWSAISILATTVIAVFNTAQGVGPFGFLLSAPQDAALFTQIYLVILALTSLISSTVITERQKAITALQALNLGLESRVLERTRALQEQEKRFRGAFDLAPIGMALVSPEGKWLEVNCSLCGILGYSTSEFYSMDIMRMTHPQDLDRTRVSAQELLDGKKTSYQMEKRYIHKNGKTVHVLLGVSLVRDREGKPLHFISQFQDVTLQKKTEENLKASEESKRALLEGAFDCMISIDHEGKILEFNPAAEKTFQRKRDEVVGQQMAGLIMPPEHHQAHNRGIERYLQTGYGPMIQRRIETEAMRPDQSRFPVEMAVTVLKSPDSKPTFIAYLRDISDRKKVEDDLRESESRYRTLADSGQAMIWTAGLDMKCNYFNKVWLDFTGRPLEAELGDGWAELVHPDDLDRCFKVYVEYFQKRQKFSMDYRLMRHDGEYRWIQDDGCPRYNSRGEFIGYVGYCLDITDRKMDQLALAESEERFRLIAETIDEVFWMADPKITSNFYISPAYERVWGRTRKSLKENPTAFVEAVVTEDRKEFSKVFQFQEEGKSFAHEYRIQHTDGSIRTIFDRGYPIKNEKGEIHRYVGVAQDITERKKVETDLRNSEQRLALALESSGVGLYDWNIPTGMVITSRTLLNLTGHESGDIEEKFESFSAMVHPDDMESVNQAIQEHFQGKTEAFQAEYRIQGKDGTYRWNLSRGRVIERDPQGNPIRMIGTQSDIHGLKRVESELRESQRLFQGLATTAPVGIFRTDPLGNWVYANDPWVEISGLSIEGSLGSQWTSAIHPEDHTRVWKAWNLALSNQQPLFKEFRLKRDKERISWVLFQAMPIRGETESGTHFVGTVTDITELKLAQDAIQSLNADLERRVDERTRQLALANSELAKAAKMKDEFLASMSHELRTPLNGVLSMSEAIQEEIYGPVTTDQISALRDIESCGKHLLSLINDILDLSKIQAGQEKLEMSAFPVGINCEGALRMVKETATRKNQKIQTRLPEDLGEITADPRRFKQILVNLLSNAVKFTPDGGEIGLEGKSITDGNEVEITVWDTGIGISQENLGLIFKPFQQVDARLARQYGGTGLGLALVAKMVELHGGTIAVESELGKGSRFRVVFPRFHPELFPEKPRPGTHS